MGRQSLRIIMVLGVLVTLVGGTGTFAVFTDRSTTGTNSATSGERQRAVDIRISEAEIVGGVVDCDGDQDGIAFEGEDLSTGIFTVTDIQPDGSRTDAYLCIKNTGSAATDVEAVVIDLVDTEIACTGDEDAHGDTTCGGDQAGELSSVVGLVISPIDCSNGGATGGRAAMLANWLATPLPIPASVAPDGIACLALGVFQQATTPELAIQLAQSDKVEWRIAFDATLAE